MTRATCGVCDWTSETAAEVDRYDLSRAMIDHHVDTGHAPITSTRVTDAAERPDEGDAVGEAEKRHALNENGSTVVDGWTTVEEPTVDRDRRPHRQYR